VLPKVRARPPAVPASAATSSRKTQPGVKLIEGGGRPGPAQGCPKDLFLPFACQGRFARAKRGPRNFPCRAPSRPPWFPGGRCASKVHETWQFLSRECKIRRTWSARSGGGRIHRRTRPLEPHDRPVEQQPFGGSSKVAHANWDCVCSGAWWMGDPTHTSPARTGVSPVKRAYGGARRSASCSTVAGGGGQIPRNFSPR